VKAPGFWSAPPGSLGRFTARLLAPLGWLYGTATAWRMGRPGARAPVPIVCVGNLTAGGAGKTPAVLMLAGALTRRGERPFVVSRGYGGRLAGPVRVDPARMTAADCGDEPLLLASRHPVIVARDRRAGAAMAAAEGATVAILDDGLQNPSLAKDFALAVIDAEAGVGNGFCLPAGPLRAPVARQMRHVDALLLVGSRGADWRRWGKPVFTAGIAPDIAALAALKGRRLLAFAGIGRPEKFFGTLRDAGLEVAATRAFPDHHPFTAADLAGLRAAAAGLTLVTTEKDATRLPADSADILKLPIALEPADEALVSAVAAAIARRRSAP
jgi:tetraacyldisaccharide 4'-kinase